jgi:hypothetical protein
LTVFLTVSFCFSVNVRNLKNVSRP